MLWKIYRNKECVGSVKYPEDAACLVSMSGGQVRYGNKIVWFEEDEGFSAGESYDSAAEVMRSRAGLN